LGSIAAGRCRGRKGCIELLLDAGADANLQNHKGYTALEAAVDAAHGECADLLIARGARVPVPTRPSSASSRADQSWWARDGPNVKSRRYSELDAQLSSHVLRVTPDAQFRKQQQRRANDAKRDVVRRRAERAEREEARLQAIRLRG